MSGYDCLVCDGVGYDCKNRRSGERAYSLRS